MSNDYPGGERGDGALPLGGGPNDIVGHKTMLDGSHEPLLRFEANALLAACDAAKQRRLESMPTEQDAIDAMFEAYTRLKELGWREAIYCPKDGTQFAMIEPGSTGVHQGFYLGEWPEGRWTDGDWGMRPCLFKLSPEDEAKRKTRMTEAARAYKLQDQLNHKS